MEQQLTRLAETPDGLTSVEFARRSGIGRTTIHRVLTRQVEPTIDTLRELAIVHGYDLRVELKPLSDPLAVAAFRHMVDPAFENLAPADVDPATAGGVREWIDRLSRVENVDDAAVTAGRAASLLHREGVVYLRGNNSARRLASAGDASGQQWAVSGAAALPHGSDDASMAAPSVLWVADDARTAASLLGDTHMVVENSAAANVVVAQAHPSVFIDSYEQFRVQRVAPTQLLLDAFGFEGALFDAARNLRDEWSTEPEVS